jgi:DNA-binding NtrC family response regulator
MEYQILIVDDDKDLSWIIAEMLQDYNDYVKEIKMIEKKKALCYNKIEYIKDYVQRYK